VDECKPLATGRGGGGGDAAMGDASGAGDGVTLQAPDAAHREVAVRENIPDPLAGEQTWPTEEAGAYTRPLLSST